MPKSSGTTAPTFDNAIRACRFIDDAKALYQRHMCLLPVSKNLRGRLHHCMSERQECHEPECVTYKTDHVLNLEALGFDCDGDVSACLDGSFLVRNFVNALIDSGLGRGPHTGDFYWQGECMVVVGEMSGMTNVGTHREPVFDPCQQCDEKQVMEGRLPPQVTTLLSVIGLPSWSRTLIRTSSPISSGFGYVPTAKLSKFTQRSSVKQADTSLRLAGEQVKTTERSLKLANDAVELAKTDVTRLGGTVSRSGLLTIPGFHAWPAPQPRRHKNIRRPSRW